MEETKKTLGKNLEAIEKEIKKLKRQKKGIEKQLIELSSSFKEKFQLWYNNGTKGHYDCVPTSDKFPLVRGIIEQYEFTRYKTITLEYLVGEETLGLFLNDDYREFYDSDEEYQAEILNYQPLMEEIMKGNLKSFEMDW